MSNETTIWQKKAAYEKFSKSSIRSEFFASLSSNNKSYRHVLRFLGHLAMYSSALLIMKLVYGMNPVLGILFAPLYLFIQALIASGLMIHAHELSHNHIRKKWLNDFVGVVSGLFTFINFYSFQRAHRIHHRNIGNLDAPEAGAPVSPTGQKKINHNDLSNRMMDKVFQQCYLLGFLASWPLFIYFGDYNSWLLPFREKGRLDRKSVLNFVLIAAINLPLLYLFPLPYLGLFLLPAILGGQRILAITYMHHAHEDSVFFNEKHHNFYNIIMSTTDRDYGRLINFFMLNNGYHIPHHLNPHIAYYDLKRASAYLRDTLPQGLTYNFYPNSSFYKDFAEGLYEQRLDADHDYYQLTFLKPDIPGAKILKRIVT